jgi:hypothetical protein
MYIKVQTPSGPLPLWGWSIAKVVDALKDIPGIGGPENITLAFALGYVILILLLMSILYASKIFVKV